MARGFIVLVLITWLISITAGASEYRRPFGPNAPWNIRASQIARHPNSDVYVRRLWNEAPSDRPGNFNLSFEEYTYPVYYVSDAIGFFDVEIAAGGDLDGARLPWNPDWKPGRGSDAQIILLDPDAGIEWDLWQVKFDGRTIRATRGSQVEGNYWSLEHGHQPSRGAGIPYLAMLVRPQEIAQGKIEHALSLTIRNTDGYEAVPPATKLEFPGRMANGIPEGMRFAVVITDAEIEAWVAGLPPELSQETRLSAGIIARALRDYGCFVTDTAGGAHLQFESRLTAGRAWSQLGLGARKFGDIEYPRDLLDGLLTPERLYALVPSDQYPEEVTPASQEDAD